MNRTSIAVLIATALGVWNGASASEIVANIPGPDESWDYANFEA